MIQINEFSSRFGTGLFKIKLSIQFIKSNELISCREAQSIFRTDCNKDRYPPALVLMSQRQSFVTGYKPRGRRTTARNNNNNDDTECVLKKGRISTRNVWHSSGKVAAVGLCINEMNQQPCTAKQTQDIHLIRRKSVNSMTIETINNAIKC